MKTTAGDYPVVVYGASGHGKVVVDILRANSIEVEGFVDDDPLKRSDVYGLKILGNTKWLVERTVRQPVAVALGIGDNFFRRRVAEHCIAAGAHLMTAIHPSATVAASATVSPGTVIMPHAVVNADAVIGQGAIINTAAIVEHDCRIGNFAHLSPKVAIGGNVQVGDFAWLGIGSTVIPNRKVGTGSIIGAGATVIHDIDDWMVAVGTPARILKKLTPQN
jgi:sugar O-acyltransferase (sialic acid O-acetyltransferase NeuD family)